MYQTPLLHAAKNGHEGVLKLIREYTGWKQKVLI
jgi:hypothetical protein